MAIVAAPNAASLPGSPEITGFSVGEIDAVERFLCDHPQVRPVLSAAPDHIKRAFGKRLPLRLRIFRDREAPLSAELVVEIITGPGGSDSWDIADRNLHHLHEQWLAGLPRDATRDILFVTEPV